MFWHAKALIRSYTDYIKKVVSSAEGSLESRRKHFAERLSNSVQGAERGVLTAHLSAAPLAGLLPAAASTRSDYYESVCASTEENDVGLGRGDLIGALPNSIPEAGENLVSTEADTTDKDGFFEGFDGASVSNGEFSPASTKDDGHKALEGDEAARIPLQPVLCSPNVTINSEEPSFDHLGLQNDEVQLYFLRFRRFKRRPVMHHSN